jgi:hypothetical protein
MSRANVKRLLWVVAAALFVALAACSRLRRTSGAEASTTSAGGPVVRTQGSSVLVDGQPAGTTRAIEDLGRMQKIDELYERLKSARESFKTEHPSTPFPGRASIGVDPATPMLVFKSVFQTAAFAGYPRLQVDTSGNLVADGGAPDLVSVDAIVPGTVTAESSPRASLDLQLLDSVFKVAEKRGPIVIEENDVDAMNDADLRSRVARDVVAHVLRRDLRADPMLRIVVHADNTLPFSRFAALLVGLRDAGRRLGGPNEEQGAFYVCLSVR